jgi:aminopeptidase N
VHSNTPEVAASPLERLADPQHPTFDIAEFEATKVPFSTYLLAWIVVPHGMKIIHARDDVKDIDYEVMAVPMSDNDNKKFAMENAISCMQYYLDMFSTSPGYPFPKISLAAIPDFSAGAMENWGLVTFRDTAYAICPIALQHSPLQHGPFQTYQPRGNLIRLFCVDNEFIRTVFF